MQSKGIVAKCFFSTWSGHCDKRSWPTTVAARTAAAEPGCGTPGERRVVQTCKTLRSLSRCSQQLYWGSPGRKANTASGNRRPSRSAEWTRTKTAPSLRRSTSHECCSIEVFSNAAGPTPPLPEARGHTTLTAVRNPDEPEPFRPTARFRPSWTTGASRTVGNVILNETSL